MKKYVCTGSCGGESDTPKACDDKNCTKFGQPLVEVEVPDEPSAEPKQEEEK